jgi:hypothetical protein
MAWRAPFSLMALRGRGGVLPPHMAGEHEKAASNLLASTESKLAAQAELHSGEFERLKARYEAALADARSTAEGALQQMDAQGQAREAELVRRLEAQGAATGAELEAAGLRAEEAMSLAMQRYTMP